MHSSFLQTIKKYLVHVTFTNIFLAKYVFGLNFPNAQKQRNPKKMQQCATDLFPTKPFGKF